MTLHETRKWQIFGPVVLSFGPAVDSHVINVNLIRIARMKVYQEQQIYLNLKVVRCESINYTRSAQQYFTHDLAA